MRLGLLAFILIGFFNSFGQQYYSTGRLPLYNIAPSEYPAHHPQNHELICSKDGKIILANNIGVLIYDGVNWERLNKQPNEARTIAETSNGEFYIGSEDDFGVISIDSLGNDYYESLGHTLPDSLKNFGKTKESFVAENRIFLFTSDKMLEIMDKAFVRSIYIGEYRGAFIYKNNLFLNHKSRGLLAYKDGQVLEVKRGGNTQNENHFLVNKERIFSAGNGIFKEYSIQNQELTQIRQLKLPERLSDDNMQCFKFFNNHFFVGTKTEGLLIYDGDWNLIKVINTRTTELQADYVKDIYFDYQNNLWLALDYGLSVIDINSVISRFGKRENILGTINGISSSDNSVFLACTQGLLQMNVDTGSKFNIIEGINGEGWDIEGIDRNNHYNIFVATDNSIVRYDGKKLKHVIDAFPWYIEHSANDPKRIWIGDDRGYMSLYWNGESFQKEFENLKLNAQVRIIETDGNGDIWLGSRKGWLYYLKSSSLDSTTIQNPKVYDSLDGLPAKSSYFFPYFIYNKLYIATTLGIYEYVKDSDVFVKSTDFGKEYGLADRVVFRMLELSDNKLWMVCKEEGSESFENGIFDLKTKKWLFKPYFDLNKSVLYDNYFDSNYEIMYCGGSDDLFRVQLIYDEHEYDYHAFIHEIRYDPDSIMFGGSMFEGFNNNTYQYSRKPLRFTFGANSYKRKNDLKFRYYLEGFDDSWTEWNTESEAVYTNLPGGNYTMRVKAIDFFENESEEASFSFTILPPWYLTPWAYTLYFFGFVGFVFGAIKISTLSLQRIIKENTKEIVQQKEEIEAKNSVLQQQKGRIEKQNLNILDSIRYAKRIQVATLPADDKMGRYIENFWVMYRPKDIVSGDFYWMENFVEGDIEKAMIAAVDCTGHGVPGAFMSIIGFNGLNRVVREYRLSKPSEILDRLNEIITTTLNQQGAQREEIKDGMDLSFCALDKKTLKLEYAGAHNSLYIIRKEGENLVVDGEKDEPNLSYNGYDLFEVKADKQPIGAFENRKNFTNHEIQLRRGDMIILFTDGYADQFGGPKGKKFFYKPFKRLLLSMAEEEVSRQHEIIEQSFNEWISYPDADGDAHEQIDDICVIGLRV